MVHIVTMGTVWMLSFHQKWLDSNAILLMRGYNHDLVVLLDITHGFTEDFNIVYLPMLERNVSCL